MLALPVRPVRALLPMALSLLLLTGCWPFDDDEEDPAPDFEDIIVPCPFGFVGNAYAFGHEYTGGDWPHELIGLSGQPAWASVTVEDGDVITVAGTPDAVADLEIHVSLRDEAGVVETFMLHLQVLAANAIALTGDWMLTVDVTSANSVCAGDENDPPSTDQVIVEQIGQYVSISGIQGQSSNTLHGELYPNGNFMGQVTVSGTIPEDGGETTITYNLNILDYDSMTGHELWNWQGQGQQCSGLSDLTMTRVP